MKVRELLKKLNKAYSENKDMNYDALFSAISQPNAKVKKITYGKKSSPVVNIPHNKVEFGFRFTIETPGLIMIPVTFGPKMRRLLLDKFSTYTIILD